MTELRGPTAILEIGLRIVLGALFITAGVAKWQDPAAFAQEIANYQLLPGLAPHLATLLPATEILGGLAVAAGPRPWRQAGAAALFVLLIAFTAAVTAAAARGLDISCGCFGTGSAPVTWLTVARNFGLLALAGGLVFLARTPAARPA
jgi:putative oxidoreductase